MPNLLRKPTTKERIARRFSSVLSSFLRFFVVGFHSFQGVATRHEQLLRKIFRIEIARLAPVLALLLICVAPHFFQRSRSTVEAQTLREGHARLRAAMDRNDQAEAESLLRGMMVNDPDAFARNNYDYLLARLLQNRQAGAEAGTFFLRVVNRNSPLAGYALWHLGESARARGAYPEEQKLLRKFVSQRGDHLLRERAIERLADSYFKTRSVPGRDRHAAIAAPIQARRPGKDRRSATGNEGD